MSEDLYHRRILKLANALPKAAGENARWRAKKTNPLCGDEVEWRADDDGAGGIVLMQKTRGCLLCRAAAMVVLDLAKKDARGAALAARCEEARAMFGGGGGGKGVKFAEMFLPVISYPARHNCVLLPFDALRDLLGEMER